MSDMTNAVAIETLRANYPDACYEQLRCAVDIAIKALEAQDLNKQVTGKLNSADDTISRQAAIDAMEGVDWYHISKDGQLVHGANSDDHEPLYKAKDVYAVLNKMPSAQPETHEKRTETHACDCIERQAAIDAVYKCADIFVGDMPVMVVKADAYEALAQLPSAQPEIIYCKNCVKHNKRHGYYHDGTVIGIKDCCPLVEIRGMAQGHEFDYQYCVYAERRTDGSD